jgi:hypothetical protein
MFPIAGGPSPAGIIKSKLLLDPYFITGFSDVVDFIAPVSLSSCYIRASIAPNGSLCDGSL